MSDPALLIRAPRPTDIDMLVKLTAELGYAATAAQLQARLTILILEFRSTHYVRVAEAADQLLGWVQAERRLSLETGERIELVGLVVSETAKRSGVGRQLVQSVEEWARTQNVLQLVVRSNVVRAESHLFYPALGFQANKTQQVYAKTLPPMQ